MEAKDIVANEIAKQAEFGMEPSFEDIAIVAIEAGMKEMVDWINDQDKSIPEGLTQTFVISFTEDSWQAFLREKRVK